MTLTAQQARRQDLVQRLRHLSDPDGVEIVLLDPAPAASRLGPQMSKYGVTAAVFADPVRAVAAAALGPTAAFVLSCHLSPRELETTTEAVRQLLGVPVVLACERWDSDVVGPAVLAGAQPLLGLPYMSEDLVDVLAKVGVHLERQAPIIRVGQLKIGPDHREASVAGRQLDLSHTEFAVLEALARHLDTNVTRAQLGAGVWPELRRFSDVLTAAIRRLRRKLAAAGLRHALVTVRGVGYRLDSSGCAPRESIS